MSNEPFDDVHETRSLPFGLFGKSPILRAAVVNVLDKTQQQIAEDAKMLLEMAAVCVVLWWMNTNIAIPLFAGKGVGPILLVMMKLLTLALLPFAGLVGIIGIIHAAWYARKRWKAQPSARIGSDSR